MTRLTKERWRTCKRDHRYMISDHGRVLSEARGKPKLLSPGRTKSGHLTVYISGEGSVYVHALVAETFLPEKPSGRVEVRHKDGDPGNNFWENLAWSTKGQNNRDRKHHAGWSGKLKVEDVSRIKRRLNKGEKGRDLAFEYGVGESAISAIKCGHNHSEVQP